MFEWFKRKKQPQVNYGKYPNGVLNLNEYRFDEELYSPQYDRLLTWLVDHKDVVRVRTISDYWVELVVYGRVIKIWNANYPFAVCTHCEVYDSETYFMQLETRGYCPSEYAKLKGDDMYAKPMTVWKFLDTFAKVDKNPQLTKLTDYFDERYQQASKETNKNSGTTKQTTTVDK